MVLLTGSDVDETLQILSVDSCLGMLSGSLCPGTVWYDFGAIVPSGFCDTMSKVGIRGAFDNVHFTVEQTSILQPAKRRDCVFLFQIGTISALTYSLLLVLSRSRSNCAAVGIVDLLSNTDIVLNITDFPDAQCPSTKPTICS